MTLSEDEETRALIRELVKKAACISKKSLVGEQYLEKVHDIGILLKKISAGIYKIDNQSHKVRNLDLLLVNLKSVLVEEKSGLDNATFLIFHKDGTGIERLIKQLINRIETYKDDYIEQIKKEIDILKHKESTPFTTQQMKRLSSEIENQNETVDYLPSNLQNFR
jgi:hypothetical protein